MSRFDLKQPYKPKNFLDLYVPEEVTFENSQVIVVPYGYEGTVTFGHGTSEGPEALIKASWQVELFDDDLMDDIQDQVKIWTTLQPKIPDDPTKATDHVAEVVTQIISINRFPVVIGGEHLISYGFARALSNKYNNVSILVFDAHLDLGDRWSGKDFTHAAWLKYALDSPNIARATLVGIRNFNKLEWEYAQKNPNRVRIFFAKDKAKWNIDEIVNSLSDNVFLSFDVDAFDSSVMPSTGTPEPGGLFWDEVLPIIREVAAQKNIVGMDLVELAPIKGLQAPDFVAAKLLMKMILYKFKAKQLGQK